MEFDSAGLESYETNLELERTIGVWLVLSRTPKVRIKVLREGGANHKFDRTVQRLQKPHRFAIQQRTIEAELLLDLLAEAYAAAIVIDWEGVTSNGDPVPCTPENVKAFLLAKPNIFEQVQQFAREMSTFAQSRVEEAAEALGNSSDGTNVTTLSEAN